MSRFIGGGAAALSPYVPGEQPQDKRYIKLNTNESPYPPAPGVRDALARVDLEDLRLYPDPDASLLRDEMSRFHNLAPEQVFVSGGSDEALGYIFMAFFDTGDKVYFPDITYGFYTVYARLCRLNAVELPLEADFSVNPEAYFGLDGHIVIANPNAPTGIALSPGQVEEILLHNPDRLVVVDEAYVDFSDNKTCVPLLAKYDNLLVVQTYSKSRGLAGMRIGCALGSKELCADLNRIKYSFNPYNLDRLSIAAGVASTLDKSHLYETVNKIIASRDWTKERLIEKGFEVLPSETNFLFARHPNVDGFTLYEKLKSAGILVRHFNKNRIGGFVRITIGTPEEMSVLIERLGGII